MITTPHTAPIAQLDVETIQKLVAPFVDLLDNKAEEWEFALRQDAVESLARIDWFAMRRGCHVPVYNMFVLGMRSVMMNETRRFIADSAPRLSTVLRVNEATLLTAARNCLRELELNAEQSDIRITRGFWEKRIDYRIRFEAELQVHTMSVYERHLRPHFSDQMQSILTRWQRLER